MEISLNGPEHSSIKKETNSKICTYSTYRVFQVKLANCNKLFQIENMDRFLIKWYFDYCNGGNFYMEPKKFRKKSC